ncbi:hypothetical protein HPB51_026201 [Rhipicephalus microplus]|uniref:Uncharacterized protein n=1 Tax=Rhipicephalus microplus TaxID=6941 RepID=A0A9J6DY86_RHIMP|nr:hypothetical protein HPB51_026201 [Rhipicephalus microplus]
MSQSRHLRRHIPPDSGTYPWTGMCRWYAGSHDSLPVAVWKRSPNMNVGVRQVGLIPAGCQTWHVNVASFSGHRFAYAATLAVYIYEMDESNGEFKLLAIMAEHKRTVTAIDWHPTREDWIASGGLDPLLCVWDIGQRTLIATLREPLCLPLLLAWRPDALDTIAYVSGRGPLHSWSVPEGPREPWREAAQFQSAITQMTWHSSGKLALGHQDGSLSVLLSGGFCQKHVRLLHDEPQDSEDADPRSVVALRWDEQSSGYLLAGLPSGQLFLLDWTTSGEPQVLATYACPSRATTIAGLAWVPDAAGMFLTGDKMCGTLRVWNVSRNTPLENLQLHGSGFRTLCVCTSFPDRDRASAAVPSAECAPSQQPAGSGVRLPPHVRVLCLFSDGAVGLYNIRRRSWDFLREMAHTETIFDCQFKPDNCNLLATAGFDGTLKIWNMETMKAVMSSPPRNSTIYCLSWAPSGQDCVALGTAKNGLLIWDTVKNVPKKAILDILKQATFLLSMIHRTDGKLVQTFHHPKTVYGCDWNPNNESIFATACGDSVIRIYYLGMDGGVPLKTLEGHAEKAFRVKWSPLRDGVLCSTSDDCTIHVWNYTCDSAVRVLRGHTDLTRSVVWSTELSHLLLSGSWDATIRLWDTRDGVCICALFDHGADIYGEQPLGRGKELLCGSAARQLKNCYKSSLDEAALRAWSSFFCSKAHELELVTATRFGGTGVGGPSREQSLRQAAQLYLSTGNLRKYCEILTELGAASASTLFPASLYDMLKQFDQKKN